MKSPPHFSHTPPSLRRPKTALKRQVLEGVLIEEEKVEELLNSKSEFGQNRVPRIRVEVGNLVLREGEEGGGV